MITSRFVCTRIAFLFVLTWFLVLWTSAACRAGEPPVLLTPASASVLRIAVTLPAGLTLDTAKDWQLVETGTKSSPIAAALVAASATDGTISETAQALVASIPPQTDSEESRRFELVEAKPSESETKAKVGFRFAAVDEKSLGLWEGDRPVFVYNHGMLGKAGVPSDRDRSTYLHPIHGLDGEILTDDFPKDHFHHRGLFWAWPHVLIGAKQYSLWDLRGIEQRFERWIERRADAAVASLAVENGWYVGDRKVMQERARFTVHPAAADSQAVDIEFVWIPTDQPITLAGAEEKSYGGLTLRFAPRNGTLITTPLGNKPDDLAMTPLAWADLSAQFAGAPQASGAAIFISPDHPDFPPTWLTRHYGVLCVGWPGVKPAVFQPGEIVRAGYRLWIHRQSASAASVALAYESYQKAREVRWEAPATD